MHSAKYHTSTPSMERWDEKCWLCMLQRAYRMLPKYSIVHPLGPTVDACATAENRTRHEMHTDVYDSFSKTNTHSAEIDDGTLANSQLMRKIVVFCMLALCECYYFPFVCHNHHRDIHLIVSRYLLFSCGTNRVHRSRMYAAAFVVATAVVVRSFFSFNLFYLQHSVGLSYLLFNYLIYKSFVCPVKSEAEHHHSSSHVDGTLSLSYPAEASMRCRF